MGLDMFLNARNREGEDTELGYWRKHPDLHGYIVQKYANGVDNCQKIFLKTEDLEDILKASEEDRLPNTQGHQFGTTQAEDRERTRRILLNAIDYSKIENGNSIIYYQASW